jgi:hypothetical protein
VIRKRVRTWRGAKRAMASAPHQTRVAMSHTANALSCGEPAARNWPQGLQHDDWGSRARHPRRMLACITEVAYRNRLLHVSALQRCAPPRYARAARPRMPAENTVAIEYAARIKWYAANESLLSPPASAGAETESQVHKHTPRRVQAPGSSWP